MIDSFRRRRALSGDSGFGLVEVIVSLGIATLVLTSLAFGLAQSLRTSIVARTNQTASDALSREVENVRAMDFGGVVSRAADLPTGGVTGPSGSACGNGLTYGIAANMNYCFTPSTGVSEPVEYDTTNSTIGLPVSYTVSPDGKQVYNVTRVITEPNDSLGSYKRLVLTVKWTINGQQRSRTAESFIANTRRGLPLPRYTVKQYGTPTPTPKTQAPGSYVDFGFYVDNLGARDAFDITASDGLSWKYYLDSSPYDGVLQSGEPLLGDFNANGKQDTGEMEPDAIVHVIAERLVGTNELTPQSTTFSLQSIAQPSAPAVTTLPYVLNISGAIPSPTPSPTSSPSPSASPSATPTSCASATSSPSPSGSSSASPAATAATSGGTTLYGYTLNNGAGTPTADTTTQDGMPFTSGAPTTACLWNFSSEAGSGVGRLLSAGSNLAATSPSTVALWTRLNSVAKNDVKGTGVLTVYVQCVSSCPTLTLTAAIGKQTGATGNTTATSFTSWGTGTATITNGPTSGFMAVSLALPATQSNIDTSTYLAVRLVSSAAVRLAYDSSSYPATVTLPLTKAI